MCARDSTELVFIRLDSDQLAHKSFLSFRTSNLKILNFPTSTPDWVDNTAKMSLIR